MTTIQPSYLSLLQLLQGRLFRIPDYQRAYSWEKQQRTDLFSDIDKLYDKEEDQTHFMAQIVCLKRKTKKKLGSDSYDIMEIVDGQQRITTLILLLNALKEGFVSPAKKAEKVIRELGELIVKDESGDLLLLQTNHDTSHYFENYLKEGVCENPTKAKTLADKQILNAIQECGAFVDNWVQRQRSLIDLASILKNQLYFLLHEVAEEKTVYTVFECLNSRGMDVQWLDRLKSILMGKAFELSDANNEEVIEDLHAKWSSIYTTIGLNLGMNSEILRYAATLNSKNKPSKVMGESDAVITLKDQSNSSKELRKTASWLLKVAEACNEIAEAKRTACVSRITHARLLAAAIIISDFSQEQKKQLLHRWECVTFRIFGMMRLDSRYMVGDYVRLAWMIVNEKLSYKDTTNAILEIGNKYPIEIATEALKNRDCYNQWESELRYFMFNYDRHLEAEENTQSNEVQWEKIWHKPASESIEHIRPQSKADEAHKHRLGNLIVIPPKLNSKLKAKPARLKAKNYRETGLRVAIKVAETIDDTGWNNKAIRTREFELIEWAKIRWADDSHHFTHR